MFELIATILCSSSLFFIFRYFEKFKIDLFQAVVFNYFVCFISGSFVFGSIPSLSKLIESNLLIWVIISGILFISLFVFLGISSQKNGMGITSVAVKMSLALSAISLLIINNESISIFKILGFLLAITGIILIAFQKDKNTNKANYGILLYLFLGSACLDLLLNIVQNHFLKNYPSSLFTAFGFLSAGFLGLIALIYLILIKKTKFQFKNILAGICLGVPNYFSIYFLVKSYSSTNFSDSTILAIMNIGVVALSAIFGIIFFKESTKIRKIIGLFAVVVAILCLTL